MGAVSFQKESLRRKGELMPDDVRWTSNAGALYIWRWDDCWKDENLYIARYLSYSSI